MHKRLRHSPQRDRIYEYLIQSVDHPSAEMIYSALRTQIPNLSMGTVYRNLRLLEELGKVRRVTSFQGTERYDAICSDHVHFLCGCCGLLRDVENTHTEEIRAALPLGEGYQISKLDLTITGTCPDCAG